MNLFVFVLLFFIVNCECQVQIDPSVSSGRLFDGIGGISGGGATSKLLVSYPEKQRNEILDFLFKPQFAASLHILKVEIGGDSDSTEGTESSHMHEPWDENYSRGYEWWLMTEAKKRNPDIKLYALPWAFPGWIKEGGSGPYVNPSRTSDYVVRWIEAADKYYNLTIDYIGIWNERNYDTTYIKTLRSVLDHRGFGHVDIVAPDGGWGISTDMWKDQALMEAVYAIGAHYPGTTSTNDSQATGHPLWASEDYSTYNDDTGAGCWARILNQNYVNGYMTSTISWNLIAAYYQNLPFGRDGLMTAMEPWSGHYVVEGPIWVTAHTTQFTKPGWWYLSHGHGVGKLDKGGSYVSLVSPDEKQLTVVIETMSHNHSVCIRPGLPKYTVAPQTVSFQLKGSLSRISTLHKWSSRLSFGRSPSTYFSYGGEVQVTGGVFSLNLGVDELITMTTLNNGEKGKYTPSPPSKTFPLPYADNFNNYKEFEEAHNFGGQVGVWEIRASGDASHGMVNRQVVQRQPTDWCFNKYPINIGGNYNWTDISIEFDVLIPSTNGSTGVVVAAQIGSGGCGSDKAKGIYFTVNLNNTYTVTGVKGGVAFKAGVISPVLQHDVWFHLKMTVKNKLVRGYIGSSQLFSVTLPASGHGFVGYGTANFGLADFDNFQINSV